MTRNTQLGILLGILCGILALIFISFYKIGDAVRMQRSLSEYSIDRMHVGSHQKIVRDEFIFNFYTFWDKETGREVMCLRNDNCWLTGRKIDEVK